MFSSSKVSNEAKKSAAKQAKKSAVSEEILPSCFVLFCFVLFLFLFLFAAKQFNSDKHKLDSLLQETPPHI